MPDQINKISVEGTIYQITPSDTGTFNGTSEDSTSPSSWTTVAALSSGETNGSIFTKISQMFKNIRYLYSKLGNVDISSSGNSITDAIANLETNKADTNHTHSTATTAAAGFMPVLEDDTTKFLRSDGIWVKPAGAEYDVVTTAGPGLAPTLDGDPTKCLLGDGSWGSAGSTYADVTTTASGLMTSTDKIKLDTIDTSANNYTHPTHTSAASGLYKVSVDGEGHVTGATAVAKSDITALGIPESDTNTTYANFTSAAAGLVPAAKSGTTNYATSGYVLTGAGWLAGTKYNTDTNTTYANFTSAAAGLVPAAKSGTTNYATSGYVLTGAGWLAGTKYNTDTNTTYAVFTGSTTAAAGANGLVPAPTTAQVGNYFLKHNKTWAIPPNTTYAVFTGATTAAAGTAGLVLAPTTAQVNYFLKGNRTWAVPTNTTYAVMGAATSAAAGTAGLVPAPAAGKQASFLRGDKAWAVPTNTTYAFSNGNPTLAWGTKSTVGTVGGVALTVTMPANPNTNTTYGTNVGCYGTLSGTTLTLNTRNFRV